MSAPTLCSLRTNGVIPEEERLRRIGVFVCQIAQLETVSLSPALPTPPIVSENAGPDERVLCYLFGGREAAPGEIRLSLGLSRTMTYRTLQRLELKGQVVSCGSTRAVVYRAVTIDPARN